MRHLPKRLLQGTPMFYLVDPAELDGFDDWAEWLSALLDGMCAVVDDDGQLVLAETRKLVDSIAGLRVVVHPDDHNPPHFHVESQRFNASFRIDNCEVLAGSLSPDDLRKVRYWHQRSKPKLEECWASTRPTVGLTSGGA